MGWSGTLLLATALSGDLVSLGDVDVSRGAIERSADPSQGLLLIVVGGEVGPVGSESPVGFLFPFERIPSWMLNRRHPWLCRIGGAAVASPTAA